MGTRTGDGVRIASASSIEIDFRYRGLRCRERIALPPTPRNLRYATNLRGQILTEIAKGTFDYATHFPDSPRVARVDPDTGLTVAQALDGWYRGKKLELEHSTLDDYRRIIDRILNPAVGALRLRALTRQHVKDVIAELGADVSPKWINNVLAPLRGMLADALLDELIDRNPCEGIKVVRRRKLRGMEDDTYEVDPFTPEEVRAILAACCDPQFRNFCQFNFATGLRMSEMLGLWWPRCDLAAGTVAVTQAFVRGAMKATKTAAGRREVTLLPAALAALQAQRAHTQLAGGAVFCLPGTTMPWNAPHRIRDPYWIDTLKRAGVRYRAPKQMRHTFASQALSAGENLMWVARQLGHKHWSVTARFYARWIPSAAPDAGAKMAALWMTG